jgi:hypothetical protein
MGAALTVLLLLIAILLFSGSRNSCTPIRAEGDLDGDGAAEEYVLADHVLTVKEGAQQLWQSPKGYHIDSFALGDVENRGKETLVVSLWKKGSFGEMKPFWHKDKDEDYKNHLFVYQLQDNVFKQVWCSSNLDRPILSFSIRDINGDGLNELIVEEGQYKKTSGEKYAADPKGKRRTAIWQWEEWGFRLQEASNDD